MNAPDRKLADLRINSDWAKLPLFDRSRWQRVCFGDVVQNINETCDPAEAGIERFIGLEHLEPGSLHIREWGNVADGTTFTRRCQPGQVLFGKRRAYQRKVAMAKFDAVVSGDIYVLSPKNEQLLSELLPFLCISDRFFDHAVETSAGSLSPRTNWTNVAAFEFDLPPLHQQQRIAKILYAIDELQRRYFDFQESSWEQFSSLLSSKMKPPANGGKLLGEAFTIRHGWPFEGEFFNDSGKGPILLTPGNFGLNGELYFTPKNTKYFSGTVPGEYVLSPGDLVVVMTDLTPSAKLLGMPGVVGANGSQLHNQRIGKLQFDRSKIEPRFAYYIFLSEVVRQQIRRTASGTTVRHTSPSRILEAVAGIPKRTDQAVVVLELDSAMDRYKACARLCTQIERLAVFVRDSFFRREPLS